MIVSQFSRISRDTVLWYATWNQQNTTQHNNDNNGTPHYLRSSRRKAASNRVKKSLHPYEDY